MYFTQVEIENFKSFHQSGPIDFERGFNVFVGRNGAGKTALLDALGLRFADGPHRSSLSLPNTTSSPKPRSTVRATFRASWAEIHEVLMRTQERVSVSVPDTVKPNHALEFYKEQTEITVRAPFVGNRPSIRVLS